MNPSNDFSLYLEMPLSELASDNGVIILYKYTV